MSLMTVNLFHVDIPAILGECQRHGADLIISRLSWA